MEDRTGEDGAREGKGRGGEGDCAMGGVVSDFPGFSLCPGFTRMVRGKTAGLGRFEADGWQYRGMS
jgi:hypothetical protein